ncbi:MAG: hypothetical protein C0415_03795 [Thermodesulfovibrio sp.]|nr:hypothetical protein [Thermodesulfovibrio sp.]
MKLILPEQILKEMLVHCKEGYPNEVCGIFAGKENEVSKIYKMTNIESSPVSYFMDSREQFKVMKDMRENNLSMLAIYHSHPSSPPYPSGRDISLAFYEDAVYVIVGLLEKEPVVKGFLIREEGIKEADIIVR